MDTYIARYDQQDPDSGNTLSNYIAYHDTTKEIARSTNDIAALVDTLAQKNINLAGVQAIPKDPLAILNQRLVPGELKPLTRDEERTLIDAIAKLTKPKL